MLGGVKQPVSAATKDLEVSHADAAWALGGHIKKVQKLYFYDDVYRAMRSAPLLSAGKLMSSSESVHLDDEQLLCQFKDRPAVELVEAVQ